ncbi:MAG: YkvA family protein [Nostocoides sp.]
MAVRHRVSMVRNLGNALRIATRPGGPSMSERLSAVPRMVRATASGDYQGTSVLRLAALAGALAYVVSPVDLIPEGIFAVFGLADDAMVLSWLAANLVTETEEFLAWERDGSPFGGRPAHAGSSPHAGAVPSPHSGTAGTVLGHVLDQRAPSGAVVPNP